VVCVLKNIGGILQTSSLLLGTWVPFGPFFFQLLYVFKKLGQTQYQQSIFEKKYFFFRMHKIE